MSARTPCEELLAAAETVLAGLEDRIQQAPPHAIPVFDGIARLAAAINKARRSAA